MTHRYRIKHAKIWRCWGHEYHPRLVQLGHTSERVTERHYIKPGTVEGERVRRFAVLQGGVK